MTPSTADAVQDKFPFGAADIESWTIKKTDGSTMRFLLSSKEMGILPKKGSITVRPPSTSSPYTAPVHYGSSLSRWCKHDERDTPVFVGKNAKGEKIELFINDASGTRANWKSFDFVLDAGDVLGWFELDPVGKTNILSGDAPLSAALNQFVATTKAQTPPIATRVLKIKWFDRCAPELAPEFWPALLGSLHGRVLCNCQGGHGRSGTSLTILMMLMTSYSALDALTHLRAIHCARAIESKVQHEYIDKLATFLGREANAHLAGQVKSFRERFLSLTDGDSAPYRERLKKLAGKLDAEKDRSEVEYD